MPVNAEYIYSAFTGIVDLLYLSLSVLNLYQFLILCSSKVLLLVKSYFSNTYYLSKRETVDVGALPIALIYI